MRIRLRGVTALACFLTGAVPVYAQGLGPKILAVGSGVGQIGVVASPNEECRGPATVTATGDGRLAVLDKVNNKIVVIGSSGNEDLPLPQDLIEPADFVATTRGFVVVEATGGVVLVDRSGNVQARGSTQYNPEAGAPRLVFLTDGRMALEDLGETGFRWISMARALAISPSRVW